MWEKYNVLNAVRSLKPNPLRNIDLRGGLIEFTSALIAVSYSGWELRSRTGCNRDEDKT